MSSLYHLCLAGWDDIISQKVYQEATGIEITVLPYLSRPFKVAQGQINNVLSFSQATNLIYNNGCEELIRVLSEECGDYLDLQSINGIDVENIYLQYSRVAGDTSSPYQILAASRLLLAHYIQHIRAAGYSIILFNKLPHLYVDYLFSVAAKILGLEQFAIIPFRGLSRTWKEYNEEAGIYVQAYNLNTYKRCSVHASQQMVGNNVKSYKALTDLVETFKQRSMHRSLKLSSKSTYLDKLQAGHNKDRQLDMLSLCKDEVVESSEYLACLKRAYERVSEDLPANPRPFMFFPLHKQPEASTNPSAFNDWSQEVLISQLGKQAKRLGLDLYVKEHPHILQWSLVYTNHFVNRYKFSRSIGIYEALSKGIKNLTFLQLGINPDYIISHPACAAVVTSEGSSGISGLIHSKLVVLAGGDPWYGGYKDCISIKDFLKKREIPGRIESSSTHIDGHIKYVSDNYILYLNRSISIRKNCGGIMGLLYIIANELGSPHGGCELKAL